MLGITATALAHGWSPPYSFTLIASVFPRILLVYSLNPHNGPIDRQSSLLLTGQETQVENTSRSFATLEPAESLGALARHIPLVRSHGYDN